MESKKSRVIALAMPFGLVLSGCSFFPPGPSKSEQQVARINISNRLDQAKKFPWRIDGAEERRLLSRMSEIQLGMRVDKVLSILGSPNTARPIARKDGREPDLGFSITYYLLRINTPPLPNMKDEYIWIMFTPDGLMEEAKVVRGEGKP